MRSFRCKSTEFTAIKVDIQQLNEVSRNMQTSLNDQQQLLRGLRENLTNKNGVTGHPCQGFSPANLTFGLQTGVQCHRDTDKLPAEYDVSATLLCRVIDKHAWNKWQVVITLTFNLYGHRARRWGTSSYLLGLPRLKFIGLPVPKICPIFCHDINRPSDLEHWPLISEWGHGSTV